MDAPLDPVCEVGVRVVNSSFGTFEILAGWVVFHMEFDPVRHIDLAGGG